MVRALILGVACMSFWIMTMTASHAQQYTPPAANKPNPETMELIEKKSKRLGELLSDLKRQGLPDIYLVDIEVYLRAAEMIVRHDEFFHKDSATWTLDGLDRGMVRAAFLAEAKIPWLTTSGQTVVRGYRSRIDGSVQPFAVTYPVDYAAQSQRKWRVDVVLHGRDASLTEAKFLYNHRGNREVSDKQDYLQIDIFGRGNNAYRWAGETDVFEALDHFLATELALKRGRPDSNRVVLRGFSMGGAGSWHLGLHWPSRWCVIGPGAGFSTTHGYTKLPTLPAYQESCLRIYDAVDYAENAVDVPIVAYSGSLDPQKAAADNVEKRLQSLGLSERMTHLIAPGLEHKFPPEWFDKANALYRKFSKPAYPPKVRFVTYTLKYPSAFWVQLLALDQHYEKAEVEAERLADGFLVKTQNVHTLALMLPEGKSQDQNVTIDGQSLRVRPISEGEGVHRLVIEKLAGIWQARLPRRIATQQHRQPRKTHAQTGPIDDAFCEAFLVVRGTGKPWHEKTGLAAQERLERFRKDWSKYWRGDFPIKNDIDVTDDDIEKKHLIVFGDPSSNSLLMHALDGLPCTWTREEILFAGCKVSAQDHLPVMIYPSPLNPRRYLVLNSGPTIPSEDYSKTNAMLFPRLGDFGLLRIADASGRTEIVTAGLFDEFWSISDKK